MAERLNPKDAFRYAEEDVAAGIGDIFKADLEVDGGAFALGPPFDSQDEAGHDGVVAVPWRYECRHVGNFRNLFPTGRSLTIHGVTFVDGRGDEPVFHRYVDWAGVFTQLGLTVSGRVLVDEDAYRAGLGGQSEEEQ